jgi:transcription antitermination factor NusG
VRVAQRFSEGDWVECTRVPFKGRRGVVVAVRMARHRQYVDVSLTAPTSATPVEIDARELRVIKRPPDAT